MRLALDTNRYVDFCRGDSRTVDQVREAERIYLPFVTLAELRAGFLCGTKARHNERVLTRFLNSPRVRTLYADEQTTHHYARLFLQSGAGVARDHRDQSDRHAGVHGSRRGEPYAAYLPSNAKVTNHGQRCRAVVGGDRGGAEGAGEANFNLEKLGDDFTRRTRLPGPIQFP